ncbi:MAG TPA: class I SAM-dependent methyltransferase [Pyrinomonadaceae bacterium]|nr:class I SAM-dependent methyltransferase [Pyrinomonadaceae bacterium]
MGRKSGVLDHWDESNRKGGDLSDDILLSSLLEGPANLLLQAGYKEWIGTGYEKILDVGSGLGRWALYFNQLSPESLIYAADFTPSAMLRASRYLSNRKIPMRYCCADAFNLPFADESFNLVHSFGLIEDYPNYMDMLKEQMRVLKPGGRLICVTLHHRSWHALYKKLFGSRYYSFTSYEHDFSAKELTGAFEQLGLKNIELSYAEPMHRIAAARPWKLAQFIEYNLKRVDLYLEHRLKLPLAQYWSHDIYIKGDKPA